MSEETIGKFSSVTKDRFTKLVKGYASAKDNLQLAIGAAVYQAIAHDNTNWLNELFENAGFWQSPVNDKHRVSADGRLVFAYLTTSQEDGGCGLSGDIIRLDREIKQWKLVKGRALYLDELDHEFMWELLATVRFDRWGKPVKAPKAYNPQTALHAMQKKLAEAVSENTLDTEAINDALATLEGIRKALVNAKKPKAIAA